MADERSPTGQREERPPDTDGRPLDGYRRGVEEEEKSKDEWSRHEVGHPGRKFIVIAVVILVLVFGAILLFGYIPRHRREQAAAEAALLERESLPVVTAEKVKRAPRQTRLMLPGNITALTEASIFARAAGYVRQRYVDFGDRVRQGQLLTQIDAPELDQEVAQGRAALAQAEQQRTQAAAQLQQARAQLVLNKVTRDRYAILVKRGALSRQDGDTQETAYQTQYATVNAYEANLDAAEANVRASRANLDRLIALQEFKNVRAPFTGVITARNFDLGALVSSTGGPQAGLLPLPGSAPNNSAGSTTGELFREAQIGVLRILINVPQTDAASIHVGMPADVTVSEYPGRKFGGTVTRTANSLDLNSRTLLTEVDVPNPQQLLLPGMYAQVDLNDDRATPPIVISSDAVLTDAVGLRVAVLENLNDQERQQVEQRERDLEQHASDEGKQQLQKENQSPPRRIHLVQVQVGRDYGAQIEIISGLQGWEYVILNPSDVVKEGAIVRAAGQQATASANSSPGPAGSDTGKGKSKEPGTGTKQQ